MTAATELTVDQVKHIAQAATDVLAERTRQQNSENWSHEHDDQYAKNELALAAAVYALPPAIREMMLGSMSLVKMLWPWDWAWYKPRSRREDLVRAGALILAEIERIDREAQRPTA